MPTTRHIIVCEGESERAYLQRLQAFLDDQEVAAGSFDAPLCFIGPEHAVANIGTFGKIKSTYNKTRTANRGRSIHVWADFDLYHRNDKHCATHYAAKTAGIPDFLFSFHNFEDFIALHTSGDEFREWLSLGNEGYFENPAPSPEHSELIKKIVKGYRKGSLPADFVTKERLMNLKANLSFQPKSNPHRLQNIGKFADFLVGQLERHHPEVFR